LSYHVASLQAGDASLVSNIHAINNGSVRINGGFFAFKKEIFDYIGDGEELVVEPFQRLVNERQLIGYPYDGFWASMDTFKDKQFLDDLYARGGAPWEVWKANGKGAPHACRLAPALKNGHRIRQRSASTAKRGL
jgi:glucose-1-phosphate cytidylyltransferase